MFTKQITRATDSSWSWFAMTKYLTLIQGDELVDLGVEQTDQKESNPFTQWVIIF